MDRLLEDIQEIVRTQPIQLPTEFAFFGRAISTFTGVIYSIYPNADFIEMARPTVMDWVAGRTDGIDGGNPIFKAAQRYLQPLLGTPFKLQEVLEEPKRFRRMRQESDRLSRASEDILSKRRDIVLITLIPFIGLHVGIGFAEWEIVFGTSILTLLGAFRYRNLSKQLLQIRKEDTK